MFTAANTGAGMWNGMPDVCNTPSPGGPVPVPYPCIAMNAQADGFSDTVMIGGLNAMNVQTKITMTSAMEGGSAHNTIKGEATFTQGCQTVEINGAPGIAQMAQGTGNKQNCAMTTHDVPSTTTVTFACAAAPGRPSGVRQLAQDQADGLRQLVSGRDPLDAGVVLAGSVVRHVRASSAAARAGLRVGDQLVAIGGRRLAGAAAAHRREWLRVAAGCTWSAEWIRERRCHSASVRVPHDSTMVRSTVAGGTVRIGIPLFTRDTPDQLRDVLRSIDTDRGSVHVDLRDNPGGCLPGAMAAAVLLAPVAVTLLVNRGTASAAERLITALPHAAVVGGRTAGKTAIDVLQGRSLIRLQD